MVLSLVDEPGVDAERDVVEEEPLGHAADVDPAFGPAGERFERGERIVAVEAEISGEMVARAERDADEGRIGVECGLRDRGERPVAACHAEDLRSRRPCRLPWILAVLE